MGKGTIELRKITQPHRATLLRLLVAGSLHDPEEAEALMGYAANAAIAAGAADTNMPRMQLLKALAEVQLEVLARQEALGTGKITAVSRSLRALAEQDWTARLAPALVKLAA